MNAEVLAALDRLFDQVLNTAGSQTGREWAFHDRRLIADALATQEGDQGEVAQFAAGVRRLAEDFIAGKTWDAPYPADDPRFWRWLLSLHSALMPAQEGDQGEAVARLSNPKVRAAYIVARTEGQHLPAPADPLLIAGRTCQECGVANDDLTVHLPWDTDMSDEIRAKLLAAFKREHQWRRETEARLAAVPNVGEAVREALDEVAQLLAYGDGTREWQNQGRMGSTPVIDHSRVHRAIREVRDRRTPETGATP